ncbi:hypothetical protein ACB358_27075 [Serratia nevei]
MNTEPYRSLLPHPVFKHNDYLGVTTILTQGGKHPVPLFVVIADNLNFIGVSLKAQWFRWILNNRKLKLTRKVWLSPKTYDFVRTASSPRLQSWIRNDFRLLMIQGALLVIMCLLNYLLKSV